MLRENPAPLWKRAPFLRLVIPLIAGTGFQLCFPVSPAAPLLLFFISFLLLLLFHGRSVSLKFRFAWIGGCCVHGLLFAGGMLLAWRHTAPNQPAWYGHHLADSCYVLLTIEEPPVEKPASFKAVATVEKIIFHNKVKKVQGRVIAYFAKDSLSAALQYGQQVLVPHRFVAISHSGNPGAFDYARYCRFRHIFHQAFFRGREWKLLPTVHANTFRQAIFQQRARFLRLLEKYIPGRKEAGLAEALLLGYRDNLDKELVQAYANTGVVHIIAISGMHLALIYGLLRWLLKPLPENRKGSRYLKPILIIAGLWLFALLTGGAPSVLRSALMFTAMITGSFFLRRQTSVYNTLAASAFLLLCYDPFFLADVGFQLSYLAVLGILIFQRPLYKLYRSRYRLPDRVWQWVSVSLAAQVLTFPLCLYYFHQFPVSFLLANLVAVPLSGVILTGCIMLLCLSPVKIIAGAAGWLLGGAIQGMNTAILKINALPFAVWDGFTTSLFEMALLYIAVISLAAWLIYKRGSAFILLLGSLLLLLASGIREHYRTAAQKMIIVYNTPPHTALDFIDGHASRFVGDTALLHNASLFALHLGPARAQLKLKAGPLSPDHFWQEGSYIQFYHTRLLVADGLIPAFRPMKKLHIDLLILTKNTRAGIPQLADQLEFDQIIFDASCPRWKIEKWKSDCERLNLRHFSVPDQGAFIFSL